MAEPKDGPKDGPNKKEAPKTSWQRMFLIWGGIGVFLLLFGGLAAQGYMRLMPCPSGTTCPGPEIPLVAIYGLVYLSVGGGVALGLIGVALSLASARSPGWGIGLLVVGAILFIIFVWPTPFKYYRTNDQQLIRIHRVTGNADYVPDAKVP